MLDDLFLLAPKRRIAEDGIENFGGGSLFGSHGHTLSVLLGSVRLSVDRLWTTARLSTGRCRIWWLWGGGAEDRAMDELHAMMKQWEAASGEWAVLARAVAAADPDHWEGAAADAFRWQLRERARACSEAERMAGEVVLAFAEHVRQVAP